MIDTHAHVYTEELAPSIDQIISEAQHAGLTKILMPNVDLDSIELMMNLAEKYPLFCLPMMGLHPCYVPENFDEVLSQMYQWFEKQKFVAVGETGLDMYWDKSTLDRQIASLKIQCEWALEFNLPIVLHSREATKLCIDVIQPYVSKGLHGVFHCFSGTLLEACAIVEMGFYLGIGGVITFKNSNLREIVNQVDPAYLLLETDSPYLAPVPYRGKTNQPGYLTFVNQTLANTLSLDSNETDNFTSRNAIRLFGESLK